MTRISENQAKRRLVTDVLDNRQNVNKYSEELSSGLKVSEPGDSVHSGTISQFRQSIAKIDSYKTGIAETQSFLEFQDNIVGQVGDLLIRLKEIGTQGVNESNSEITRSQMSEEVFQIRDHIAQLANSTYQGRYVFGGADDDDPPYDVATYTVPASGLAHDRYVFDAELGTATLRSVQVTDDISVTVNTQGNLIFDNAIQAAERLGRSLAGYTTNPAVGAPDGTGVAYTFPSQFANQSADIRVAIDLLDTARDQDILPERVSLGGRLRRLDTASSLLEVSKQTAQEVLSRLQNTDETESASNLALAQTALQASYSVTAQVLRLSIMDFL